jgi:O-antigen ligase
VPVPLLERAVFLLALAGVAVSALAYPWRLPDQLLARLDAWAGAKETAPALLYLKQLRPQVAFSHSVLVYKECIAAGFAFAALCACGLLQIARASRGEAASYRGAATLARSPGFWALLLAALALASALLLSPNFSTALATAVMFGSGALLVAALAGLRPGRRELGAYMAVLCLAGCAVALVALLQHLGAAGWFLPRFDDPRNRMGSLIGHNTGVSAWLSFALFFSLHHMLSARGRVRRVLSAANAALVAFVIVAAQSRAMWLILGGALPLFAWAAARAHGVRVRPRFMLLGLLAVLLLVASQSVAPGRNPLARHAVSIAQRVRTDFAPSQLLRETRLRILVVSLPLVAKAPVLGHGVGSFQYVYPEAQGEYLRAHPDTVLGMTTKRTDLAHNDYLQLLVEGGVAGFVLVLVPVVMLLARGWRAVRRMPAGADRAACVALLFPLLAVAAQALVDFPFHIAPTALAWLVGLALWAVVPCSLAAPEAVRAADDPVPAGAAPRSGVVATLVVAGLILCWAPVGYVFVLRTWSSDIFASEGRNWLETARAAPAGNGAYAGEALMRAREMFRRATRINTFNGSAYEGMAQAFLELSNLGHRNWQEAEAAGDAKAAEQWRRMSADNAEHAIQWAETQRTRIRELRYHFTYHQIGAAYYQRWRAEPGVVQWLESARTAFEEALRLNPADSPSLHQLAEVLDRLPNPDAQRSLALRQQLFRVDPGFAAQHYLVPAIEAAARGERARADRMVARCEQAAPGDWHVTLTRADLLLREAQWPPAELDGETTNPAAREWFESRLALGKARLAAMPAAQARNRHFRLMRTLYAVAERDYASALEIADGLAAEDPSDRPMLVLRSMIADRAGRPVEAWPGARQDAEYWRLVHIFRLHRFGERGIGARQLAWRAMAGGRVEVGDGLRAAAWLKANGEWDLAGYLSDRMAKDFPQEPQVRRLADEVKARRGG